MDIYGQDLIWLTSGVYSVEDDRTADRSHGSLSILRNERKSLTTKSGKRRCTSRHDDFDISQMFENQNSLMITSFSFACCLLVWRDSCFPRFCELELVQPLSPAFCLFFPVLCTAHFFLFFNRFDESLLILLLLDFQCSWQKLRLLTVYEANQWYEQIFSSSPTIY